jgi:putative transposase
MQLCINMLLDWIATDHTRRIERLLWFHVEHNHAVMIDIFDASSMPYTCSLADLLAAEKNSELRVLTSDPFSTPLIETDLEESHLRRRDRAWDLIAPIVELPDGKGFDEAERFRVIQNICANSRVPRVSLYRYLRRYWKRGQAKNALLPDYDNSGAPGKERVPGATKRGRPRKLTVVDGLDRGINIGPDERRRIQLGMKLFFEEAKGSNAPSLRRAYHQTLERHFNDGFILKQGVETATFASANELPSYDQVRYWYLKDQDPTKVITQRDGERRFNLKSRSIGGDAAAGAFGPGSVFQIDSTPAIINLASALNPRRGVGRPNLYFVMDVFSRMIVGFAVTLEEPSYIAAMLAVENTLNDKVEFCANHGFPICEEEWPSHHIPESLVADRGELISKNADHLAGALGIAITNTPPYRADLKPFVERQFRTAQDEVIQHLPGAVNQRHERGDRDERLDAVLTLGDFRKIVIQFVLTHNSSRIEGFRPQEFMIRDGIEPRPIDLWKWGIENRSGHLRSMPGDIVRLNLLPRSEATVTEHGIRFKKVYYTCETALKDQWQVRARSHHAWKIPIAYHPHDTNLLYIVKKSGYEPCKIVEASAMFANRSWADVADFDVATAYLKDASATREVQSKADRNAQIGEIVRGAVERQNVFDPPPSKAAALRGIRENRQVDRQAERHSMSSSEPEPPIPTNIVSIASQQTKPASPDEGSREYIPRPSDFARLRALRDQQKESK